jgi:hypothetical protein
VPEAGCGFACALFTRDGSESVRCGRWASDVVASAEVIRIVITIWQDFDITTSLVNAAETIVKDAQNGAPVAPAAWFIPAQDGTL